MVSMKNWVRVFKRLGCPLTQKELRCLILSKFLLRPKPYWGSYIVDGDSLWDHIMELYPECRKEAEKLRLKTPISVESWIEEIKYRELRSTYPRNMHKKFR